MIQMHEIQTVEHLEEWVKYRGTKFGIYDQYKALMEAGRDIVAVQYPGKKFEWPKPILKPCRLDAGGQVLNAFVHCYEFPDGFKTGCYLVMGQGEFDRYITNIISIDQNHQT